jgi:hypothetical protein
LRIHSIKFNFLAFAIFVFLSRFSHAGIVVFTDRSQWTTAVGSASISHENFESVPVGILALGISDLPIFDFYTDGTATAPRIQDDGLVNGSRELFGRVSDGRFGGMLHRFDFVAPVYAFAADYASTLSSDGLVLQVASSQIRFSDHLAGEGDGFLGIVSDIPFVNVTYVPAALEIGEGFHIDNVSIATVPEPHPICLFLVSITAFVLSRLDRRLGLGRAA